MPKATRGAGPLMECEEQRNWYLGGALLFIQVKPFGWGPAKVVTSECFLKPSDDFRAYFFEAQNGLCIIHIASIIT